MFGSFLRKSPQKKPPKKAKNSDQVRVQARLHVSELRLGMYVRELDRPWEETSFMFQGFSLDTPDDITSVQDQCEYVEVDYLAHQIKSAPKKERPVLMDSKTIMREATKFAEEFNEVGTLHNKTKKSVDRMFSDMQAVKDIDGGAIHDVVNDCVTNILKNPDAVLWYTQMDKKDSYLSQHSLNVAILSIALGKHLRMPQHQLEDLGTCGLLHDIGKTRLPASLLYKTSPYTEHEKRILRGHTLAGRDILLSSNAVFSGAADVAFSHHEHVDGSGYPAGEEGSKMTQFTKIVAIADRYDDLVNSTTLEPSISTTEALRVIYEARGTAYDKETVLAFIKCVGAYPPGTIVEMTNGEVGIVLSNNSDDKLRPRVIMLLDENKDPQPQRVVDLSQMAVTPDSRPYSIRTTLRNRSYDIDIDDYVRGGLRIESVQ